MLKTSPEFTSAKLILSKSRGVSIEYLIFDTIPDQKAINIKRWNGGITISIPYKFSFKLVSESIFAYKIYDIIVSGIVEFDPEEKFELVRRYFNYNIYFPKGARDVSSRFKDLIELSMYISQSSLLEIPDVKNMYFPLLRRIYGDRVAMLKNHEAMFDSKFFPNPLRALLESENVSQYDNTVSAILQRHSEFIHSDTLFYFIPIEHDCARIICYLHKIAARFPFLITHNFFFWQEDNNVILKLSDDGNRVQLLANLILLDKDLHRKLKKHLVSPSEEELKRVSEAYLINSSINKYWEVDILKVNKLFTLTIEPTPESYRANYYMLTKQVLNKLPIERQLSLLRYLVEVFKLKIDIGQNGVSFQKFVRLSRAQEEKSKILNKFFQTRMLSQPSINAEISTEIDLLSEKVHVCLKDLFFKYSTFPNLITEVYFRSIAVCDSECHLYEQYKFFLEKIGRNLGISLEDIHFCFYANLIELTQPDSECIVTERR